MIFNSEKDTNGTIEIHHENGIKMGDLVINDDGYYVFFPEERYGYWPDYVLLALGQYMTNLNKPWDEEINKYFKDHNEPS